MTGRPQGYLGRVEDRLVECESLGAELAIRHDPWEWSALTTLRDSVEQLVTNLVDGYLEHALADAESMRRVVRELIQRDVQENRKHRAIAGRSREVAA